MVKDQILNEATRLFARNGVKGTSLQAVADKVGIRKQSLLYHFKSKGDLRAQVNARLLSHWKQEIPELMAAATSGRDRFSSAVTALLDFFKEDPDRARLMMREMMDDPVAARAGIIEHLRPLSTLLLDYIRMGQQAGIIKADVNARSYLVHLIVMVMGAVAVADVAGAMFEPADGEAEEPDLQELVRMARAALFVDKDQGEGPSGRGQAPPLRGNR